MELAMAARAREDHELFAMNAGITIERISKAALMRRNPALLVEMKGSAEMLLHLTGMKEARKVRTIGMTEAINRLRQGGVLPHEDLKLDLLVDLRNGVAHSRRVARGISAPGSHRTERKSLPLLRSSHL